MIRTLCSRKLEEEEAKEEDRCMKQSQARAGLSKHLKPRGDQHRQLQEQQTPLATMWSEPTNYKLKPHHESFHQHQGRRKVKSFDAERREDKISTMISLQGKIKTSSSITTTTISYQAMVLMAATLLVLVCSLKPAICDNSLASSSSSSSSSSPISPVTPVEPSESAKVVSVQTRPLTRSKRVTRSSKSKDREQMLSSLAEEIERKHNSLMFGPQRSSKFDDGHSPLVAFNFSPPTLHSSQRNQQPQQKTASGKLPIRKFDDGMRQIYQMHEHAAALKAAKIPPTPVEQQPDGKRASRISMPTSKLVSSVITHVKPKLMAANSSSLVLTKRLPALGDYISTKLTAPSQLLEATKAPFQLSYLLRPPTGVQARPTRFPSISKLVVMSNKHEEPHNEASKLVATTLMEPANSLASSDFRALSSASGAANSLAGASGNKQSQIMKQKSPKSLNANLANHLWFVNPFIHNSLRDLLTLSQLPILASKPLPSTAPSVYETGARRLLAEASKPLEQDSNKLASLANTGGLLNRLQLLEDAYGLVRLIAVGMRNKKDPLLAMGSSNTDLLASASAPSAANKQRLVQRSISQLASWASDNQNQVSRYIRNIKSVLPQAQVAKAKPRGVMWEMATDPSLAVTVFHLIERASVALPLGFMLMPIIRMFRNPLGAFPLGSLLPPRASHRSVDIEELAKRLDLVDKMLSRAIRSAHRGL